MAKDDTWFVRLAPPACPIDEIKSIEVPGCPIFRNDALRIIIDKNIKGSNAFHDLNLSLLYHKLPYWFRNTASRDITYTLSKGLTEQRSDGKTFRREHNYKTEFLKGISRLSTLIQPEYEELFERHYTSAGSNHRDLVTGTRLLTGFSGSASIFETDIILHPYYGFPIIPASAVKGATLHYLEEYRPPDDYIKLLPAFEGKPDPKTGTVAEGAVVFYDAWPVLKQGEIKRVLELDNIATHYPRYYRKYMAGSQEENPADTSEKTFPKDNENPNLVFFLAVAEGISFRFALRPARNCRDTVIVNDTLELIVEALTTCGIGGKTGSNYGYFRKGEIA